MNIVKNLFNWIAQFTFFKNIKEVETKSGPENAHLKNLYQKTF